MRVVYLAAGAGGMYCGSCIRDNRLAATLKRQGRDVLLIPMYTPLRTDEPDASDGRIQYGGLNVFLESKSSVFRRMPRWMTGWLNHPWLLRRASALAGKTNPAELGELTVSILEGRDGRQRRELEGLVAGLRELRPAIVNLPNLMFIGIAAELRRELGAKIVCTLSGEDLFLDGLPAPYREASFELIRRRVGDADLYIAVSEYYRETAVRRFGIASETVEYVPLGVRIDANERRSAAVGRPVVGFLARISPEKGLKNLVRAAVTLAQRNVDFEVRAGGYLGPEQREYLAECRSMAAAGGIEDRFTYVGELSREEKEALLKSFTVMALPTEYAEAKGLPVIEALAAGTPVVLPARGSFPEIVRATGGGRLYDPMIPDGLADALQAALADRDELSRLGASGRRAVAELHSEDRMAQRTWELYERLAG